MRPQNQERSMARVVLDHHHDSKTSFPRVFLLPPRRQSRRLSLFVFVSLEEEDKDKDKDKDKKDF